MRVEGPHAQHVSLNFICAGWLNSFWRPPSVHSKNFSERGVKYATHMTGPYSVSESNFRIQTTSVG